ncbi:hypothetical protein BB559_001739 [Furculomyces boomerangus]|uniref:Serine aminopeptidase S33 domain-containing protein n=1 Tax=Furculomyces boomerangus TaxID=61424 RepID=A0A2T9Z0U3_9FUNG|nr:hypothetical protein BB559_001739 [Furculomyces boomerangus]
MSARDDEPISTDPFEVIEWVKLNNLEYYTRLYKVKEGAPIAVLIIIHGFGEHCDRYEAMARRFVENKIQVFTFDLKGFGRTGRKNGQLGGLGLFKDTFKDIKYMIDKNKIDGVPTFMFGHSMGGEISLNYCAEEEYAKTVKSVIVSAPALITDPKLEPPAIIKSLLKGIAHYLPSIPYTVNLADSNITSNLEELEKYRKSYYNFGNSNIQTVAEIVNQGDACRLVKSKTFNVPVLIVHGKGDKVAFSVGAEEFFNNLPENLDKKLYLMDSEYHELHFEDDFRDKVFQLYLDWILARL